MGCQQMSNTLGTNHGVTWGSANTLQQQQWQANGCNTRPQADAPVPAPATGAAAQAKAIADAAADAQAKAKALADAAAAAQAKAKALADAAAAARDISWTLMPGSLSDIGVGGGMLWGVDSGGKIFRLTGSTWTLMPAATVGVARRVSVDSQGNSWVVNAEGDIFTWNGSAFVKKVGDRLDGNNLKMPFSDIGVGPNGAVWAVAKVDKRNNPGEVNGSWVKWTGTAWGQGIGGEPKSVSVDPQGAAWTVDAQGYIGKWDGSKSDRNSANARAIDVAACPNGDVFIVGTDKAPYKWNGSSWDKKTGANLMNIACDAQGKVYATSTTQQVFVGVMAASASAAAALEKALADAAQAKALADAAAAAQAKAMADAAAAAQAKAKADAAQNKAWDDEAAAAGAKALAAQAAADAARAKLQAQANATAPVAAPELPCGSGQVRQNGVCVSLAAAQLSISAGNAGICTKNQTAYLANEEKVANNKSNEIQAKIKAVEDEKMSRDKQTNIDYAPNPKFDWSANIAQANQLRLVLANNQQGAQDKIRALTNEQIAWTALHKTKVENWLKDSRYNKSICP
jgi:hypothetical protein